MNDIAMNLAANGQSFAYSSPQAAENQEEGNAGFQEVKRESYTMDFSSVFDGDPEVSISGDLSMMGRYLGWGSGHVVVDPDGTSRMMMDSYTQIDFAAGTLTKVAYADFFASSGDSAAAVSFRAAVRFDASYLPGDLGKTVTALSDAYHDRQGQIRTETSGAEQANKLNELDSLYEKGSVLMAGAFADLVGGFLERFGVSGERDKVYNSVLAVSFEAKAARLQASKNEDGLYTLEELDVAAVSISAFRTCLEGAQKGSGSEVRELRGMNRVEMDVQSMYAQGKIRGGLADLLCSSGRNAYRELLASLDGILAAKSDIDTRG